MAKGHIAIIAIVVGIIVVSLAIIFNIFKARNESFTDCSECGVTENFSATPNVVNEVNGNEVNEVNEVNGNDGNEVNDLKTLGRPLRSTPEDMRIDLRDALYNATSSLNLYPEQLAEIEDYILTNLSYVEVQKLIFCFKLAKGRSACQSCLSILDARLPACLRYTTDINDAQSKISTYPGTIRTKKVLCDTVCQNMSNCDNADIKTACQECSEYVGTKIGMDNDKNPNQEYFYCVGRARNCKDAGQCKKIKLHVQLERMMGINNYDHRLPFLSSKNF